MSKLSFSYTSLEGVYKISSNVAADARGSFERLFCLRELQKLGWNTPVVQANISKTTNKGTIRGLHYQIAPYGEFKLVRCIKGRIWDVALDVRSHSKTFLKWEGITLEEGEAFLLPPGCAHGFQTLSDHVEILYMHSNEYSQQHETGVYPLDAYIKIHWPIPITQLSDRDKNLPKISNIFKGYVQ